MTKQPKNSFIFLLFTAVFVCLMFTFVANAQDKNLKKLNGNWELTNLNHPDFKRSISFTITPEQTTGTYTDSNGQNKTVSNISYKNGNYSFRVPDAGLVFKKIKFNGSKLEGQLTDENGEMSEKSRFVTQPVRLEKK